MNGMSEKLLRDRVHELETEASDFKQFIKDMLMIYGGPDCTQSMQFTDGRLSAAEAQEVIRKVAAEQIKLQAVVTQQRDKAEAQRNGILAKALSIADFAICAINIIPVAQCIRNASINIVAGHKNAILKAMSEQLQSTSEAKDDESVTACLVCGLDHESNSEDILSDCVDALKAENERLTTELKLAEAMQK